MLARRTCISCFVLSLSLLLVSLIWLQRSKGKNDIDKMLEQKQVRLIGYYNIGDGGLYSVSMSDQKWTQLTGKVRVRQPFQGHPLPYCLFYRDHQVLGLIPTIDPSTHRVVLETGTYNSKQAWVTKRTFELPFDDVVNLALSEDGSTAAFMAFRHNNPVKEEEGKIDLCTLNLSTGKVVPVAERSDFDVGQTLAVSNQGTVFAVNEREGLIYAPGVKTRTMKKYSQLFLRNNKLYGIAAHLDKRNLKVVLWLLDPVPTKVEQFEGDLNNLYAKYNPFGNKSLEFTTDDIFCTADGMWWMTKVSVHDISQGYLGGHGRLMLLWKSGQPKIYKSFYDEGRFIFFDAMILADDGH